MSLLAELKRRNVLRVIAAYIAVAWLIIQVVETLFPMFGFSDDAARTVVIMLAIGLLPAVVLSWAFELTPEGLRRDSRVDHSAPSAIAMAKRLDRLILLSATSRWTNSCSIRRATPRCASRQGKRAAPKR